MPCPHQKRLIIPNQSLNAPQFSAHKAPAPPQAHRIEPQLSLGFLPLHVNMGRLVAVRRVEEEPVWPGSKNCRQRFQCTWSVIAFGKKAGREASDSANRGVITGSALIWRKLVGEGGDVGSCNGLPKG